MGGFSVDAPELVLQPGDEILPCWIFPLQIEGPSRFVAAGSITVGAGMHHGNLTTRKQTGDGIRPCNEDENTVLSAAAMDVLNGGQVLFVSSVQLEGTEWHRFPDGMATFVKEGYEVVARMHYLNTTSEPIKVAPKYRWYTIPAEDVTQEVAPFGWYIKNFEIPPLSEYRLNATCTLTKPLHIVEALPHMHALGTRFEAGYVGGSKDGQLWIDHRGYGQETDVLSFSPPIELSAGEGVSYGCTWNNTFDKPIPEGIGDNEMCSVFGYAYPPENANILTSTGQPGSCFALTIGAP